MKKTDPRNPRHSSGDDQQVIELFFKRSVQALVLVAIIGAGLWWFLRDDDPVRQQADEVAFTAPLAMQTSSLEKSPPPADFPEQGRQRGIHMTHFSGARGERMLPETMGSGVAFIDVDNDGDDDLFFANGAPWPWDPQPDTLPTQKLFLNDGTGHFSDATAAFGLDRSFYGTGVAVGDVNGDGWRDLFVSAVGRNRLFINQKGQKFIESPQKLDCMDDAWSMSAGFFDYDRDGDLDLFVVNYVQWNKELDYLADYRLDGIGRAYGPPSNFPGSWNCLFENRSGQLVDVTEEAGLKVLNPATGTPSGKGLALVFLDVNQDGWLDVAVANDTSGNFLFINDQKGHFIESADRYGVAYDASGKATGAMGLDTSHFQNTADFALSIGNFANEMTSFYVKRGQQPFFTDESVIIGVGPQSRHALSFGLFFFDYDLDGRPDFFQTNGHVENEINRVQPAQHYAQKSQLFWNCGNDCPRPFVPVKDAGDLTRLDVVGRAASYGDVDGDGDLDIVLTQVNRPALLFINQSDTGHWLRARLHGPKGNPDAIGARAQLLNADGKPVRPAVLHSLTRSYLAQTEPVLTFGLGAVTKTNDPPRWRLRITWPDGQTRVTDPLEMDRLHDIYAPSATTGPMDSAP